MTSIRSSIRRATGIPSQTELYINDGDGITTTTDKNIDTPLLLTGTIGVQSGPSTHRFTTLDFETARQVYIGVDDFIGTILFNITLRGEINPQVWNFRYKMSVDDGVSFDTLPEDAYASAVVLNDVGLWSTSVIIPVELMENDQIQPFAESTEAAGSIEVKNFTVLIKEN